MLERSDKRDFHRMAVDCLGRYRIVGDDGVFDVRVRDLSASGMLLIGKEPAEAGARLHVAVLPENDITPPLYAVVEVIRCDPLDGDDEGCFSLACSTVEMPDAAQLGDSFP